MHEAPQGEVGRRTEDSGQQTADSRQLAANSRQTWRSEIRGRRSAVKLISDLRPLTSATNGFKEK